MSSEQSIGLVNFHYDNGESTGTYYTCRETTHGFLITHFDVGGQVNALHFSFVEAEALALVLERMVDSHWLGIRPIKININCNVDTAEVEAYDVTRNESFYLESKTDVLS